MARNRPKGNGPHMVPEHKTYTDIDFECKYFGDNFSCNYHGGLCNMKWARVNCKFYEGQRPKLKKVIKINIETKSKSNNCPVSKGIINTSTSTKHFKNNKQSI